MPPSPLSTSSSKSSTQREWLKFFKLIVLQIILPSLMAIIFIEWLAWQIGATLPPQTLALAQNNNLNIVAIVADGIPYNAALKLARIAKEQPDLVLIGTSRCGQVRSGMFQPYKMHNACLTAWTFDQIRAMLDRVATVAHPKIVVFTLDYFMFTDEYEKVWSKRAAQEFNFTFRSHFNSLINLGEAFKASPKKMLVGLRDHFFRHQRGALDNSNLLGFYFINSSTGFRYDGSVTHDRRMCTTAATKNEDKLEGLIRAVHGAPGMSPKQIDALRKLADDAKRRGIILVGIQLPLMRSAINFLDTDKDYRPYSGVWRQFESKQTALLFKKMGIHYFDMSHDPINADPFNFFDAAHSTERGFLGALIHQLNNPDFKRLFPKIKIDQLKKTYAQAERRGEYIDLYTARG